MKITRKVGERNNKGMRPHVDHDTEGWIYTLYCYEPVDPIGETSACFMDHRMSDSGMKSICLYRSTKGGWYVCAAGPEVEPTKFPSRRSAWAAAKVMQ